MTDDMIDCQYGSKHKVKLWLRIFPASVGSGPKPWLLWIHGGGWCSGQHFQLHSWLRPLFKELDYHIVSVSHRFSPIVGLQEILEDVTDAFEWCRTNLQGVLSSRHCQVDLERWIIGGESSGAHLASLLGMRLEPRPRALIDVYGPVDLVHQYQFVKGKHASEKWSGKVSEEDVAALARDRDPSHAVISTPFMWNLASFPSLEPPDLTAALTSLWRVSDEQWSLHDQTYPQIEVREYMGYKGIGLDYALRLEECQNESERVIRLREFSAFHMATKSYPPTVFLHGTVDVTVPLEQSTRFAKLLLDLGVDVLELYCPGADHGWDNIYTSPEAEGWSEYVQPNGIFLSAHV